MPSPEQVERAIAAMRKLHANYVYFFEHNTSPDWIEPLRKRGFFQHPPAPVDHPDGMRSFPTWPETQYLVRMAEQAPDQVAEILLDLPASENIFVHDDIVQAALKLPAALARRLSVRERKWIRSQKQVFGLLPDRYAELVVRLAAERGVDEAYLLARTILEVRENPQWAAATDEQKVYMSRQPVGLMQHWDYQRAVEKILPALSEADPLRTLKLFSDLLQNAMQLSEPMVERDPGDHSYIWRPAIEEHRQNLPSYTVRDALVDATRDAALRACNVDPANTEAVIVGLEARRRSVFRRIALYALGQMREEASGLAVSRLGDWEIFDDPALRHEYSILARAHFKAVPADHVERLLEHLRTPPPMENFRRNFESLYGRAPNDEEVERVRLGIELRHLAVLADFLPDAWRRRYEELVAQLGAPEHPDFTSYSSEVWTGPTSPKTAEELLKMPVDELVPFLREWQPSGERHGDSYDGLGRQLTAAVAEQPERFAGEAMRFAELDPTYVRALIDGLDQATRDNKNFEWLEVVELAAAVLAQPVAPTEAEDVDGWEDRDPGWRWARGSIAHLLTEGLRRSIPIELRERIWAIIAPLTEEPEPSPEYEARYGGTNMDPMTLSINTNRGKAMHAVVSYALWVRRDDEKSHPERVAEGFDAIPEVREVLDAHLDPERDPSVAIRAVYGERLPWLVLLDAGWVESQLPTLFPEEPALHPLRDAVWETYLANSPYDNVFDVLLPEYHRAVREIGDSPDAQERRRFVDPAERLAEHLIALYWRGRLTWENESGLLTEFFERAPDQIRAEALESVGRKLWRGEFDLTPDQIQRLQDLWERRLSAFEQAKDSHRREVAAFGWWFASSGKLPDDWLLSQLLRMLEAGARTDADHLVIERLAGMAFERPLEALRATRLMVGVQREPHFAMASQEELRRLVTTTLVIDDEAVRAEARALLNALAARGFTGLDDLAAEL